MKKFFTLIFLIFAFSANAKETTFNKELFDKALSDGKVVVISSWIKYCTSCASQMKILDKAKKDFNNIEDVQNLSMSLDIEIHTFFAFTSGSKELSTMSANAS